MERIQTTIEIEKLGDFDVSYTDVVMVSPDKRDVKGLVKTFCELNGLKSLGDVPYKRFEDVNEKLIRFLKKEGFRILKTDKIFIHYD